MQGIEYIYELCEPLPRCGPGDNDSTRRAYKAMPNIPNEPSILDIGCGTGMQTIELAKISNGKITALDNHQGFLDILMKKAHQERFETNIIPKNRSMLDMDFPPESYDIIWSEGALYILGFQNGLNQCRELLKNGGYLAVTELVYLSSAAPSAVVKYLESEYPAIKNIKDNVDLIQNTGFRVLSNFTLPESSWLDHYYLPMEKELPRLIKKYQNNELALKILEAFQNEIDIYKKYSQYYGYEFFIMQKA